MRLVDCWMPVFDAVEKALAQPSDTVGEGVKVLCDRTLGLVVEQGYSSVQAEDSLFAVVAWIDEQAMTRAWPGREEWRRLPLQGHYFATSQAGVEFYQRLERLADEDVAVREVFALAMLAGFEGRFAGGDGVELSRFRQGVLQRALGEIGVAPLDDSQPLFIQPPTALNRKVRQARRAMPRLTVVLVLALPLVALSVIYLGFDSVLAAQAALLLEHRP